MVQNTLADGETPEPEGRDRSAHLPSVPPTHLHAQCPASKQIDNCWS